MLKRCSYPGFLIIGLGMLVGGLYMKLSSYKVDTSYTSVTATITKLHRNSHKSSYSYSINTKEYRTVFALNKGAANEDVHNSVSTLSSGNQITVLVKESEANDITSKGITPIYGLATNQVDILTPQQWKANKEASRSRLLPYVLFFGLLMTMNGVWKVPAMVNLGFCLFFILVLIIF